MQNMGTDEHILGHFRLLLCPYTSKGPITRNKYFSGTNPLFSATEEKSIFINFSSNSNRRKKNEKVLLSGLSTHGYKSLIKAAGGFTEYN